MIIECTHEWGMGKLWKMDMSSNLNIKLHHVFSILPVHFYCICKHNADWFNSNNRQPINIDLKGTATLIITMFYMKDLNKPWTLILVSSK